MIVLILFVVAIVCFVLAALGVPSRVGWEPLAYALITAAVAVMLYGGR